MPNDTAMWPASGWSDTEHDTERRTSPEAGRSGGPSEPVDEAAGLCFELFVSRRTTGPRRAAVQVRRILEALLPPTRFQLAVIDVHEHSDRARAARVLATPTLIRRSPGPEVRIVGDFSDQKAIRDRLAAR